MDNVVDLLKERGLIKQIVYEDELKTLLKEKQVKFYVGYDPTADSLTLGHFMTVVMARRLQDAGLKPYILVGGATALIGDPTFRSDMRPMLTKEQLDHNVKCIQDQLSKIISFEGENCATMVNNADWLMNLNYVDFIREIGATLSVNKMLTCDCFKKRLEKGLSFLEFNYMPMQAYDFYHLFNKFDVQLQVGGDDQWSNMLAGADLIRRKLSKPAFALTIPLLLKSDGTKMGKSAGGAIWLDKNKTSVFDFYQYLRNVDDGVVENCLRYLTFLTMEQIEELTKEGGAKLNHAKEVLAFEVTKLVHGEEEALMAQKQARAAFGGNSDDMQTVEVEKGIGVIDLIVKLGACTSKGEARRLIDGKAVKLDDVVVDDYNLVVNNDCVFHKGKKFHKKVVVK
ncbi:MAG: tyrosine--tRNA ligase [Clostridia bacterium]|nr:tyrosine--tRNA ligase [Clostridia bacterium]